MDRNRVADLARGAALLLFGAATRELAHDEPQHGAGGTNRCDETDGQDGKRQEIAQADLLFQRIGRGGKKVS